MRRVFILFVAILLGQSLAAQEDSQAVSLVFDTTEWNMGRIDEEDGPVSYTFRYRNEADHSVAIERVYTSCGCTTSDYSRKPLKAGGEGSVVVTFDPEGRSGRVDKSITLVFDSGRGRTELRIKGRVNPRPQSVADEYPYDLGGGLRADVTYRSFGKIAQGDTRSMALILYNSSDEPLRITPEWVEQSGALELFLPEQIAPDGRVLMTMTYTISGVVPEGGLLRDSFRILIEGAILTEENLFTTRAVVLNAESTDN